MAYAAQGGRGRRAVAAIQPAVRCAVYARKSTTEGQDSSFNSVDNQQQSGESIVASQRHAGWTVVAERYHDYGFSGGNTDRPALQRLLADAKNGLIDTIVVYRLDRLSRSLIDFLRIAEDLERWGVGLVSVTENINTTTPHGRMMVNVLLSFAQYERELIGERTRDKLHAARRLGRWAGGTPFLGYDVVPEGGRIIVNKDEADQVRAIFDLYLEKGSLLAVTEELNHRGWRRKSWTTKEGKARVGGPWNNVYVHRLLTHPIYIGRQTLGDESFPGEHAPIVPKAVFDRVQRVLAENRRSSGSGHRNRHGALLRGILRCAACDSAMTHAFTERRGRSYRYYRCIRSVKSGAAACPHGTLPAQKIEDVVVEQIKKIGSDPVLRDETFRQVQAQVAAERRGLKAEVKRAEREITTVRADVGRLTSTVTMATGAAADALMAKLAETQERMTTMERRQREVADRLVALDGQEVDPDAVGRALAQFTEIWDVLLTPERERVVRLLIEQVRYDGATGTLRFAFSPAGFSLLAADLASAESQT
jgi:site-specific DNA recombinase